jgi:serine phosphatase RsbU (regulator of sigma subunit)/CHASE2 domain-containing sensor protein
MADGGSYEQGLERAASPPRPVAPSPRPSLWAAFTTIFAAGRHAAIWVAAVHALLAVTTAREQFSTLLPWTVEGFVAAAAFCLAFLGAWGVGLLGAGLGWIAGGRRGWPEPGAKAGVAGFWLGVGAPVWAGMEIGWLPAFAVMLLVLPPVLAWAVARFVPPVAARLGAAARRLHTRLARWFSQRLLIRHRQGRAWPPEMDLRGVAVGSIAGLLTMGLASLGLFDYLEAVSLSIRVRLRNEAVITPMGSVEWARYVSLLARGVPTTRDQPIVLLEIDDATLARMASDTSELGVQREVLARLKRWGASRAVLPVAGSPPATDDETLRPLVTRRPPLGQGAIRRLRRDAGALEDAVRQWDRVLLVVLPETFQFRRRPNPIRVEVNSDGSPPPLPRGELREARASVEPGRHAPHPPEPGRPSRPRVGGERLPGLVERLLRAAPAVGSADFSVYHVRQLPMLLPEDARGRPGVPFMLASLEGATPAVHETPLIINVFGSAPGALFTRVSSTTLLEERPIYDRVRDQWVKPEQFFRDRIVFLDTLGQPRHDTPIGQLSTTELLAMATDNLLTSNRLTPPPRAWQLSLMLVIGALVGSLSIRRSPMRIFQRLAVVMGLYTVTAVGLFIYPGIWVPIVSVLIAAVLSALFVLQFIFAADESELQEARAARLRVDQELAIGREIQTSLLPVGSDGASGRLGGWVGDSAPPVFSTRTTAGRRPPLVQDHRSPAVPSTRAWERSEHVFQTYHGDFEVVGWSEPSREVGGDFYDVFALEEGRLGLTLGDVSGKGVPGALFMAVTMTLLQSHAHLFAEPDEVLARTNEALYPRMRGTERPRLATAAWPPGTAEGSPRAERSAGSRPGARHRMFVTAFYGILDTRDGRLCYASAGQTPPILIGPGGEARYLQARGVPLGALRFPRYDRHEVLLAPGERLILASDGFVESPVRAGRSAGPLGYERFLEMVARQVQRDPSAHAAAILADFRTRLADPEDRDDLTLLVICHHPSAKDG